MAFKERKFIGSGVVSLTPYGGTGTTDIGHVQAVILRQSGNRVTLPNLRGGGGNAASVMRITTRELEIQLADWNKLNVSTALRGTATVGASTTTIQAFIASAAEWEVSIAGVNDADAAGTDTFTATFLRWKPDDIEEMAFFHQDEFGVITLKGELLPDTTAASGTSQYFTLVQPNDAT